MIIINKEHAKVLAIKICRNASEVARLEKDSVELVRVFKANFYKFKEIQDRCVELGAQFKLHVECLNRVKELQGE